MLANINNIKIEHSSGGQAVYPGSFTKQESGNRAHSPMIQNNDSGSASPGDSTDDQDLSGEDSNPVAHVHVPHLKESLKYIRAVANVSLDDGHLSEEVVACLHNPPQCVLEINDPHELYSLKQFLATQ
jgi:hypothetical protein